jgi:energy-coupling factor transporter transmembrane protein EcfT
VEVHILKDKAMLIAYVTLFTGIGLLAFTFISAYIFLINNPAITGSSDLVDVFGSSLAPLIAASIRIMYLGIMGWIGSGLTTRGVQLVTQLKRLARPEFNSMPPAVIKAVEPIRSQETKKIDKS